MQVMARRRRMTPLWTPRGIFDAIAGPFIAFFKTHGTVGAADAAGDQPFTSCPISSAGRCTIRCIAISGLTKDMVGAVRGSVGLVGDLPGRGGGRLSFRCGWD